MRSYYRICPDCGANLDPDERCDCHDVPVAGNTINPKIFDMLREMHDRTQRGAAADNKIFSARA